jgi:Zn-dependent protease
MNENISLGRIAGIHVGLNWSLLVVVALIAWSLAGNILPSAAPGQGSAAYWTAGAISALVFLVSLLAHELAHSIVAQRRGVRVEGITLWLFGGVSRFSSDTSSPGSSALITFVGPLTSLLLGALFFLASAISGGASAPTLIQATLSWLGMINVVLGLFNLIPAFPLDGGRLLQSLIWLRTGNRLQATRVAARIGMGFALLMIALGLVSLLFAGNVVGGIWWIFLGWFLLSAARAEEASGLIRQALEGIRVRDVMTPNPVQAAENLSVEETLHDYVLASRHSTFPIHDSLGRVSGLLTMAALRACRPRIAPPPRSKTSAVDSSRCRPSLRRTRPRLSSPRRRAVARAALWWSNEASWWGSCLRATSTGSCSVHCRDEQRRRATASATRRSS